MALVTNVVLEVDHTRRDRAVEFARVTYQPVFTSTEVRLGIPFREAIFVMEQDERLDKWFESPVVNTPGGGIGLERFEMGEDWNLDELVGAFSERISDAPIVMPETNHAAITRYREWNFASHEDDNEEYRALVYLVPEVSRSWAWSPVVSKNLA